MKMIIMAVVALLMLGGGGAGAYFYLLSPAEAAAVEGEEPKEEEHAKKKYDKDHKYEYVELDAMILPIIDEYGVSQTVSLVVSLEVIDKDGVKKVDKLKPRLTDAYLQDMYGMLNHHAVSKGGLIKIDKLKKRLNKVSTKVLGEDVVNDVLLQVLSQRPI